MRATWWKSSLLVDGGEAVNRTRSRMMVRMSNEMVSSEGILLRALLVVVYSWGSCNEPSKDSRRLRLSDSFVQKNCYQSFSFTFKKVRV